MESAYSCVSTAPPTTTFGVRVFFLAQLPDGLLHADNGRRHQRAQTDYLDVLPDGGVYDHLGRNVLAEVEDLISVVFKQDLDDIFADVVDVALDRREDDLALGLLILTLHRFLDDLERSLGRLRTHQQLRQEYRSFLKAVAHGVQCGDQ